MVKKAARFTCDTIYWCELQKHLSFWNNAVHREDVFLYFDHNSQMRLPNDLSAKIMSRDDYNSSCATAFEALEKLCSSNQGLSFLGDELKKELSHINENLKKV